MSPDHRSVQHDTACAWTDSSKDCNYLSQKLSFFAGENFKLLPFSLENKSLPDGSHKT